jgi:uncharacterized membrane protein
LILPSLMGAVEVTEAWVSMATWSQASRVGVLVVSVCVLGLALYNSRQLSSWRRRITLVALRGLLVLSLVGIFLQPALLVEKRANEPSHLMVLIDTSSSMNLPQGGQGSPTRREGVSGFLERHGDLFEELEERHELHVFTFDGELEPLERLPDTAALNAMNHDSNSTRLLSALERIHELHHGDHIAGTIVLTDGIDTSDEGTGVPLAHQARRIIEALDSPLHWVVPDPSSALRDVGVRDLGTSGFAFLLNATSIEARLEARGLQGVDLHLELLLGGHVVAERVIVPTSEHLDELVRFDFVPHRLGEQVVALRVRAVEGELNLENNVIQRPIHVIRDRVRVLQIVGQPSWDERFFRTHLKEDPNIELISFFILVNPLSLRPLDAADTALIPFPARELFEEELGGFDLVIFQNFNYGPFQTRQYLPKIANYVKEGGAFLMLGGPLSFASGGYYGTPITDILPVLIPAGFASDGLVDLGSFTPRLTAAGRAHPAIRLHEDPKIHRDTWESLEPLRGVNRVTRAHPEAVVLATHPKLRDESDEPMPVIALREVGKGRSMAVTTDSTWRWHFIAGNQGEDTHAYTRFWSSAIRWLIRDPAMSLIQVVVQGDLHELDTTAKPAHEATARVQVMRADFQPASDHPVDIVARRREPGGGAGVGEVILALEQVRTNSDGALEVQIPVQKAGVIEITATARIVGGRVTTSSDLFVVTGATSEVARTVPDPEWLAATTSISGGLVQSLTSTDPSFPTSPPKKRATLSRHHHEVWASPWVLLWISSLAGLEWWWRRRWGLL